MDLMSIFGFFLHWFTPQRSNAHRPKVLHHKSLLFIIIGFLLAQFSIAAITRIAPQILGYAANIPPDKIIELTNQKRIQNGLPALKTNNLLNQAALSKGGYMFAKNYWAHVAPDGTQPWSFITQSGYQYIHAGENLARDFTNPESVVEAWMNSSSHKENLLNSKYQDIGVAVIDGTLEGVQTTLVVQMFGTRVGTAPTTPKIAANVSSSPKPVSTSAPTPAPTAKPSATPESTPLVAAVNQTTSSPAPQVKSLFSPYSLTKTLTSTVISILVVALAFDMILVWRQRIVRLSGRSWAHITFLLAMLAALIIIRAGNIL